MKRVSSLSSSKVSLLTNTKPKIIINSHIQSGSKNCNQLSKKQHQLTINTPPYLAYKLFAPSLGSSNRHLSTSTTSEPEPKHTQNTTDENVQRQPPRKNQLTMESALEIRRLVLRCLPTGSGLSTLRGICKNPLLPAHKKFLPMTIYYQQALQHILPGFGYTDPKLLIQQYGQDYMEILSQIPESAFVVKEDHIDDLEEYEKKFRQVDFLPRKILLEDRDIFMFFARGCLGFPKPTYQFITLEKARSLSFALQQHFRDQNTQAIFFNANQKMDQLSSAGRTQQVKQAVSEQLKANPDLIKSSPDDIKKRMENLQQQLPHLHELTPEKRENIIMNTVKELEIKYLENAVGLKGDNGWYNYKYSLLFYSTDPRVKAAMRAFSLYIRPHLPNMEATEKEKKLDTSDMHLVSDALVE